MLRFRMFGCMQRQMSPMDGSLHSLARNPSHYQAVPPIFSSSHPPKSTTTDSQPSLRWWESSPEDEKKLSPSRGRSGTEGSCPIRKEVFERRKGIGFGSMGEIDPNLEREKGGRVVVVEAHHQMASWAARQTASMDVPRARLHA